jgi:hypothetical protein
LDRRLGGYQSRSTIKTAMSKNERNRKIMAKFFIKEIQIKNTAGRTEVVREK